MICKAPERCRLILYNLGIPDRAFNSLLAQALISEVCSSFAPLIAIEKPDEVEPELLEVGKAV